MTVEDLIEQLADFPLDTIVLVDAFEYGYRTPSVHKEVVRKVNAPKWWEGDYSEADEIVPGVQNAVIISRFAFPT